MELVSNDGIFMLSYSSWKVDFNRFWFCCFWAKTL